MLVADCYIHVRYRRLGEQEFEDLRTRLLDAATELALDVRRGQAMEYLLEEGSLLQRIVLIGSLGSILTTVGQYHNLRTSVIEIVQDAESFGSIAIDQFHKLTHSAPDDDIYKRTMSRDVNRLHRIISSFDEASKGSLTAAQLAPIRRQVIHDLAGLARANPDDPAISDLIRQLPSDHFPNLPRTTDEAILLDDREADRRRHEEGGRRSAPSGGEAPRRTPRRRFQTRVAIRD